MCSGEGEVGHGSRSARHSTNILKVGAKFLITSHNCSPYLVIPVRRRRAWTPGHAGSVDDMAKPLNRSPQAGIQTGRGRSPNS